MPPALSRLLLGALLLPAAPALAQTTLAQSAPDQSAFGCSRLEDATPTAYVEGRDGVFFRLALDLRLSHPVTDGSVELVARLSDALARRGTTLIFVPLPAKGTAMPDHLPPEAAAYGFNPAIAANRYRDAVARMNEAGVVTVDALTPLLELPEGELAFIPTDHHWTAAGARAVAAAVAEAILAAPGAAGLPRAEVETTDLGVAEIPSPIRREIQAMCRLTVPPAATEAYETAVAAPAADPTDIFATDAAAPPIALVGTSMSRTDAFNFDGFLAEAAGLDVANYAVTGGNQFGALTSYLLSDDFADAPPPFLVWENPIYNNLGEFGEQPLRELIAAAGATCTPLPAEHPEPDRLVAALPEGVPPEATIRADAGASLGRSAAFAFDTTDGLRMEAAIERGVRLDPTRFFFQAVEPIWEPGLARVEARFDRAVGADATLSICTDEESQS